MPQRRVLDILVALRRRAVARDGGVTLDWERHMGDVPLVDPTLACRALSQGTFPFAVMGAVATSRYHPPRTTKDVDVLIRPDDVDRAEELLMAAGFLPDRQLRFPHQPGWSGRAYRHPGGPDLNLVAVDAPWVDEALASAMTEEGVPTLTLASLVLTKLIPQRTQDLADLSRMLGIAWRTSGDKSLVPIRKFIQRYRPDLAQDLEQVVLLGQWEIGPTGAE